MTERICEALRALSTLTARQEALKFRRHSKRAELCTDDISNALRLRNVQVQLQA